MQVLAAQHSSTTGCAGLDAHPASGLVHHVYCLVRQEAVWDVPRRQADSCWQCISIIDTLMMSLVALLQANMLGQLHCEDTTCVIEKQLELADHVTCTRHAAASHK